MNRYYQYGHFQLWQDEAWADRISQISGLVNYIGEVRKLSGGGYVKPDWDEAQEAAHYHNKTGSVDDPAVLDTLRACGLTAHVLDMTEHWIAVVPTEVLGQRQHRLPALVVCLQADYQDAYWAMKTLTEYAACQEHARRENFIVIYVVSDNGPDISRTYVNVLQEAAALFPLETKQLFLDVTPVVERGLRLSDISSLSGRGREPDLDHSVVSLWDGMPALPICGIWEHRGSLCRDLVMSDKYSLADYDRQRLLHSRTGKRMMDGLLLEYRYNTVYDSGLHEWMDEKGVRLDIHESKGERWLTVAPKSILEDAEGRLPLFCVMQEVYSGNEHLAVTALGYFEALIELAAQGECILLFFVMEDLDSNDQLAELIDEAALRYPVDLERVYVTGHSHDGRFALEFSARHHSRVAAVATLGNFMGLEDPAVLGDPNQSVTDARVEMLSGIDLPCINLCGGKEHGGKLPLNIDARELPLRSGQEFGRTIRLEDRISAWQRRLRAWNCPMRSAEEILAVRSSGSAVERALGFPVDRGMVIFADGFDHYIGDLKNRDGNYHLRMAAIENLPHVPSPSMLDMAWDFVRRFARDLKTGAIKEL